MDTHSSDYLNIQRTNHIVFKYTLFNTLLLGDYQ